VLEVRSINVGYSGTQVLHDLSVSVESGQVVSIVGSNGAGKSTLLKTISGLLQPSSGEILFESARIDNLQAHDIVRKGIAHVPEGRRIFGRLTVAENLRLGAHTQRSAETKERNMAQVFELFPILQERRDQPAGTLSGGEQQMLAIGRALMASPRLLMLDEPSLGLAPKLVTAVFEVVREINQQGVSVLLVEQNVREALESADRAYVIQTGNIVMQGTGAELLETDLVRQAYLGM
jgi:branched-chain amino acid transport system ATP-binding protein